MQFLTSGLVLKLGYGQKDLETENAKLKRMYADLALENRAMKDLIEKKLCARRSDAKRRVIW